MKIDEDLIEEFNQEVQRAGTLIVLHTNAITSRIGISATEFEAMDIISRHQPISAGQLADYCGVTTGAVTGIVDRLERQRFVRRERDPKDRRRVFIVPIEDEERSKKIRELYEPMNCGFRRFVKKYTPEEIKLVLEMQEAANDMTIQAISELRRR